MNGLAAILAAIERVAPDVDTTTLALDADFREEAELDSMDFLAVLHAVRDATGIEVAETDYGEIVTLTSFAAYVDQRAGGPHDERARPHPGAAHRGGRT
jgi:acyl carrier protein